jgi:hypothetical protein
MEIGVFDTAAIPWPKIPKMMGRQYNQLVWQTVNHVYFANKKMSKEFTRQTAANKKYPQLSTPCDIGVEIA